MAKNDAILLDGIIDQRTSDGFPSNSADEVFEYFGFEQSLKDFDLSQEEIESGWVDGRDDGGIDGFFTFINGGLLKDIDAFSWPKRNVEMEVCVVTCKHHATFQQTPINSIHASISELFDLGVDRKELKGSYSSALLDARDLLHSAYRKVSPSRPALTIRYLYISRGKVSELGENVRARAEQVAELTRSLFSSCESSFDFIGATELVSLYRRTKKFAIALPVLEFLSHGQAGYVLLVSIKDYGAFVTDEAGNLRRYLFDSNVRDYLGANQVNQEIRGSLEDALAPDFVWLNNGVTILATGATVVGRLIQLEDIQIVNGLQTTESIFRHSRTGNQVSNDRAVLVKVVVSTEATHRDRIIRATNSQNIVENSALRATDKVQRDIEDILDRHDWYYERRKNYYKNIGKPPARFVTPMYLAAGFVALILKNPVAAARLKARFMRLDASYDCVFSASTPINAWVTITEVLKLVEEKLNSARPTNGEVERFSAKWRNLVSLICVARVFNSYSYSTTEFLDLDLARVTPSLVDESWNVVWDAMGERYIGSRAKSPKFVIECCKFAAERFLIEDVEVVGKRSIKGMTSRGMMISAPVPHFDVTEQFVDNVDAQLPPQPWKPGIHVKIAETLNCDARQVSVAIKRLIKNGRRNQQLDGVVYDSGGKVIAVDLDRISGEADDDSRLE